LHVYDATETCRLTVKTQGASAINIGVGEDLGINYSPARLSLVTRHFLSAFSVSFALLNTSTTPGRERSFYVPPWHVSAAFYVSLRHVGEAVYVLNFFVY